ncbi:flippase-like domain-containing protein [Rhizobium sp. TRM95111]|uniref:lysylphosphatidylglycerol synthase domain-containing protein n=1 Tax=Rhizobium alarense TaxID=2846851 RepID=UPI001F3804C8|nr:lysylphosphatidylglycerol synthase domain-containing protein [Rhizobium alarense]MCF3642725.1 flippase-like domain-containing protein [Rhizobium alarense]
MPISPNNPPASRLARHRMALLSLACIALYAAFVDYVWGWRSVAATWQAVGFGPVALVLALLVSTYFVRAWRLYCYFPQETSGRFVALFHLAQVHNLLNIMLPFRSGETSFPLLMRSEFGVPLVRATSALLVMRLLDLHALLAAGGVGLVAGRGARATDWLLWALFLAAPLVCFRLKNPILGVLRRRLGGKAARLLAEVEAGLPATTADFLRAAGATAVNWGVKVVVFAWGLSMMGIVPLAACFGGALGGELSSVLPFHAPAGVGTYPAGIAAGAVALGAPTHMAALDLLARASVAMHLVMMVSAVLGAVLAFLLSALQGRRP